MAAEVRLYLDHVKLVIKNATERALGAAAFLMEGGAKVQVTENDQVDTGFMRSAVYTVTRVGGTSFPENSGEAYAKADREVILEALPDDADAMVVAGANYSIYQELQNSFLYRGAERMAPRVGGDLEKVFKEYVHD